MLLSVLEANETAIGFEVTASILTRYDAYLQAHVLAKDQDKMLCEAARFRIALEVLGEISKGEKTIRALKPAS